MSIISMNIQNRAVLFAKLAQVAYCNADDAKSQARKLGFTTTEFYNRDGAQAYRFQNKTDLVIVCRGTQPTEWNDIKADLDAMPIMAETVSRVHKGFKTEVDDLWPMVVEDLVRKANQSKTVWFAGHSLGAAMATIMASRCFYDDALPNPTELYTYGSPRVGWPGYVKTMAGFEHHRFVNNNDIVTRVPLAVMGYRHHGTEHYIDSEGDVDQEKGLARFWDGFQGFWRGLVTGKVDQIDDHNMSAYIAHLEAWAKK